MPTKRLKTFEVDEFGIKNYSTSYLALITLGILYLIIAVFAWILLYFEQHAVGANITTYGDAFWALMMSASTIG